MSIQAAPTIRLVDLLPLAVAAFTSALVNYGGTFVLISTAAQSAGLTAEQTASWIWSMSIGIGVTGVWLSYRYREPIITAWSTPAAAFLVTVLPTISYPEAIGAYILSAAAFVVLGWTGAFEKLVRLIPPGIAAGLLAGILLQFGVSAFAGITVDPLFTSVLIGTYILLRRLTPRFAIVGLLALGLAWLAMQGRVDFQGIHLNLAQPQLTVPHFSLSSLLGVALPLFIITLTGQYMPGMLVLRNDGFKTSANPILVTTGFGSLVAAFFGSHAFNLSAISAAICTGRDAHENPSKRYLAGIISGVIYIVVGAFGVTLATLFLVLPRTFIATLAGFALLGTIGGSLASALMDARGRETALITFVATAANVTLLGIGGAFWGLIIGLSAHAVIHGTQRPKTPAPIK